MRAFKIPFSNAAVAASAESDLVDCGWISCRVIVNGTVVVERNISEPKAIVIDQYCKVDHTDPDLDECLCLSKLS